MAPNQAASPPTPPPIGRGSHGLLPGMVIQEMLESRRIFYVKFSNCYMLCWQLIQNLKTMQGKQRPLWAGFSWNDRTLSLPTLSSGHYHFGSVTSTF